MQLRAGTWNIGGGFLFRKKVQDGFSYEEEDLSYFIEQLKLQKLDLLALQEVHVDTAGASQAQTIAKELGCIPSETYPYGNSHIKPGNSLALSIISKFPVVKSSFCKLPNPALKKVWPDGSVWTSFDVGLQISTIALESGPVQFINGHTVPFHYYGRDFMEQEFEHIRNNIEDIILESVEIPTIVSVDLNYPDAEKLLPKIFKDDVFQPSFRDVETALGKGQQDHILFSHHWSFRRYEIHKVNADHALCISELELQ